ncbi:MAG: sigma-70 family RNA polymerase sigma factor [Bacilli bacterium]|nr:sigma-70 family RNA polymerase sigma factor [Bacilli bacterium]
MIEIKELKEALLSNNSLLIEEVFEQIYNDYYKLIYFIVIKIIKDPESCKEVVNDVFLKAFNHIDKLDLNTHNSSIKSWLVRIGKNEAINFYNKQKRDNIVLDEEYVNKEVSYNDSFDRFIDEFKNILTEEEIEILVFRIYYDMKLKEIAKYYNSTTSIVYTKYQKALKILKQHYKRGDFNE